MTRGLEGALDNAWTALTGCQAAPIDVDRLHGIVPLFSPSLRVPTSGASGLVRREARGPVGRRSAEDEGPTTSSAAIERYVRCVGFVEWFRETDERVSRKVERWSAFEEPAWLLGLTGAAFAIVALLGLILDPGAMTVALPAFWGGLQLGRLAERKKSVARLSSNETPDRGRR